MVSNHLYSKAHIWSSPNQFLIFSCKIPEGLILLMLLRSASSPFTKRDLQRDVDESEHVKKPDLKKERIT